MNARAAVTFAPVWERLAVPRSVDPVLKICLSGGYPGKPDVLREVSLDIEQGEIVGLVGESGSGKSTLALSILRLLDRKGGICQGEMMFCGRNLARLTERQMRSVRGKEIALIPQSALASLNPGLRIGAHFSEVWKAHRGPDRSWKTTALNLLERVGLPADERFLQRRPHQLSVGQAQRVLIAMAVVHRPRLLIADEPTSALDSMTRGEVTDLLRDLNREIGMAVLFISHDLLLISSLCGRVAILQHGEIVESGLAAMIFSNPAHPYTRALLRALPVKWTSESTSAVR